MFAPSFYRHLRDPLSRNSFFIIGGGAAAALFGVAFWGIVARFYSPEQVGLAGALLSAIGLLGGLSTLGLQFGLIRFIPNSSSRPDILNFSLTVSGGVALLASLVFLIGLPLWSPTSQAALHSPWLGLAFILIVMVTSLFALQKTAFISLRRAEFVFLQQTATGLVRLALPLILLPLGAFGIVAAYGAAYWAAFFLGTLLLVRLLPGYRPSPVLPRRSFREMTRFSVTNYLAENIGILPNYVLPLMVVGVLGATANAYFYIPFSLVLSLLIIPVGVITSFFTESSYHPGRMQSTARRSARLLSVLLLPPVLLLVLLANWVLLFFGREYSANAAWVLRLLVLSVIPFTFNELWVTIRRIEKRVGVVIAVYGSIAALVLGLSYALMPLLGLMGVATGWLAGQALVAGVLAAISFIPLRGRRHQEAEAGALSNPGHAREKR